MKWLAQRERVIYSLGIVELITHLLNPGQQCQKPKCRVRGLGEKGCGNLALEMRWGEVLVLCTSSLLSSQALDPAHRRPVLSLICVSQRPNIMTRKSQGPAVVLSGRPSAVALGAGPVLHLGPRKAWIPSLVALPHLLFLQIALRGLAKAWTSVLCASCTPGSLCAIGMQGPFFSSLDTTRMGRRVGKHHHWNCSFWERPSKSWALLISCSQCGPTHWSPGCL